MREAEGRGIARFKVPGDNPPPLLSPFRRRENPPKAEDG